MLVEQDHYRRWTTIGGSLDVVVPASRAHLRTSRRVDLAGVGHAGLLTSPVVGGLVCAALLDAEHQRALRAQRAGQDDGAGTLPALSLAAG